MPSVPAEDLNRVIDSVFQRPILVLGSWSLPSAISAYWMDARASSRPEITMGVLELPRFRNWIISHYGSEFQKLCNSWALWRYWHSKRHGWFQLHLRPGGLHWVVKICKDTHTHPTYENHIISVTPDSVDKCLFFPIAYPLPLRRIQKGLLICPVRGEITHWIPPFKPMTSFLNQLNQGQEREWEQGPQ